MYCISISHKKAAVEIREQFALSAAEKTEFLKRLMKCRTISGAVVLCTCNRSELYLSGGREAPEEARRELAGFKGLNLKELLKYLNSYSGDAAISHLFKVTCGFDSMVLGEDEILGQVKEAYQVSKNAGGANYEINVLFRRAVTCAKRIKTDTNLSKTPLSIATLAANEVFRFETETGDKQVMVIGMSGKMGETITKNLLGKPGIKLTGTVRSHKSELALEVKNSKVTVIDYQDRYRYMNEMDVVISATLSPHYTVTCKELSEHLTGSRKRLFLDVAVPVDMDPEIRTLEGAVLYDIDHFEAISRNNSQIKLKELDRARAILEEDLDEAVKEVAFHPYIGKMARWKEAFSGKGLDTLLYRIRDHVSSEELKVVLKTLDQLETWIKEE